MNELNFDTIYKNESCSVCNGLGVLIVQDNGSKDGKKQVCFHCNGQKILRVLKSGYDN